jgi:predicted Zn-dependent peptidase
VTVKTVPALGPNRKLTLPRTTERTLANGLTLIAIRRASVPLVELRLRIPMAAARLSKTHVARTSMLGQTLLSGTDTMSTVDIAAELQVVGGALSASLDPDRMIVSGNSLVTGLDRILGILAEVLNSAAYPADEVTTERDRLIDRIQMSRSQPSFLARAALLRRMYGTHPYSVQSPSVEQVRAIVPRVLRSLHRERVHPAGSALIIVGDLPPAKALDAAEAALSGWQGAGKQVKQPRTPPLEPGPITLVDRPDSVQSSVRVALPALPRVHPDHPALQLANLIFGGYFSSRWVENIREDKGYTYGPHSAIEHSVAGSALVISAEVATEVTAPTLVETFYELGRMATLPPKEDELEQARQYALGTLQLAISTQAGLAGFASAYFGSGLRLEYLAEHAAKIAKVTREDVARVAARHLAPANAVTVVLGDAERIEPTLAALTPVERAPSPADDE